MDDLALAPLYAEVQPLLLGTVANGRSRSMEEPNHASSLRELMADYLRAHDGWREHPEHVGTHLQWEDRCAPPDEPNRYLPTKLAAIRQMCYESVG